MNEILNGYTEEEIEELAIKQINFENEELIFKIENIDKEYKKHNKKAVSKAILNGSLILIISAFVMNTNSSISEFGTEDLNEIFEQLTNAVSFLPQSDLLISIYARMFEGLNIIIDKIGIVGLILATKSVKLVLSIAKDTKKGLCMKKELLELEAKLNKENKLTNRSIH